MYFQVSTDIERFGFDIDLFGPDLSETAPDRIPPAFFPAQDLSEYLLQAVQIGSFQKLAVVNGRLIGAYLPRQVPRAEVAHTGLFPADRKLFGEIFIHLVFQQPLDQLFAGIGFFLAGLTVYFPGKKHAALDIQKGRGHDQELAGHVHVLAVHLVDILEVLVGDLCDRNIVDVYFVFFNQVKEKVQRAFKHRKLHRYGHNSVQRRSRAWEGREFVQSATQ